MKPQTLFLVIVAALVTVFGGWKVLDHQTRALEQRRYEAWANNLERWRNLLVSFELLVPFEEGWHERIRRTNAEMQKFSAANIKHATLGQAREMGSLTYEYERLVRLFDRFDAEKKDALVATTPVP